MTPQKADDMTVELFREYLGKPRELPEPIRPGSLGPIVIRIALKRALPPDEQAEHDRREAFEQALRRREELQMLAALELVAPGQAIPKKYRIQESA